jgi:hypothetical protein
LGRDLLHSCGSSNSALSERSEEADLKWAGLSRGQ